MVEVNQDMRKILELYEARRKKINILTSVWDITIGNNTERIKLASIASSV
jgi:hypothetical protein